MYVLNVNVNPLLLSCLLLEVVCVFLGDVRVQRKIEHTSENLDLTTLWIILLNFYYLIMFLKMSLLIPVANYIQKVDGKHCYL